MSDPLPASSACGCADQRARFAVAAKQRKLQADGNGMCIHRLSRPGSKRELATQDAFARSRGEHGRPWRGRKRTSAAPALTRIAPSVGGEHGHSNARVPSSSQARDGLPKHHHRGTGRDGRWKQVACSSPAWKRRDPARLSHVRRHFILDPFLAKGNQHWLTYWLTRIWERKRDNHGTQGHEQLASPGLPPRSLPSSRCRPCRSAVTRTRRRPGLPVGRRCRRARRPPPSSSSRSGLWARHAGRRRRNCRWHGRNCRRRRRRHRVQCDAGGPPSSADANRQQRTRPNDAVPAHGSRAAGGTISRCPRVEMLREWAGWRLISAVSLSLVCYAARDDKAFGVWKRPRSKLG